MKFFFEDVNIATKNRIELVDITRSVEEIMRKSGITNGLCIILHKTRKDFSGPGRKTGQRNLAKHLFP